MKLVYETPCLRSLDQNENHGQKPCWSGSVAPGGQCSDGGTAGTSCVRGISPFSS